MTPEIVTMLLLSVAMALALAHALEAPGKRRLDLPTYRAIQQIYYPGFTYAGVSEPLAIVALLALTVARSAERAQFLLVVISLACAVGCTRCTGCSRTQSTGSGWSAPRSAG